MNSLTPQTKVNSTWFKGLNVRLAVIKLVEKNIGRAVSDINHIKIFFDQPPREMKVKTKDKCDQIKLYGNYKQKKITLRMGENICE